MKIGKILATIGLVAMLGHSIPSIAELNSKEIFKLANQGNAAAQLNLGVMYAKGKGVRQDYTQARQWFEKAASQGDELAQYNLGVMYNKGLGVRQDIKRAKEYFGQACDNGEQPGCDAYRKLNIGF